MLCLRRHTKPRRAAAVDLRLRADIEVGYASTFWLGEAAKAKPSPRRNLASWA